MIGLFFELVEWSVKLTIIAIVIMMRLMIWAAKGLALALVAIFAVISAETKRRQAAKAAQRP